jgi:hypothetical protein
MPAMVSTDSKRQDKTSVEVGAKFDLSLDENVYGMIEKILYDAY